MTENFQNRNNRLFTSNRERNLWICVLITILTIYSTLGLTGTLANALKDSGIVVVTFILGMILIGATIATQGLKKKPGGAEVVFTLGIVAIYVMLFTRMVIPEDRTHLIEYGVVGIFIYEALKERVSNGIRVRFPALIAIIATTLVGAMDECIQLFLPNRVFDPQDILVNVFAGALAVMVSVTLSWVRIKIGQILARKSKD